jgi:hypothetical protein
MRDFDELVCELGRARRRRVVLVAWPIVYSVRHTTSVQLSSNSHFEFDFAKQEVCAKQRQALCSTDFALLRPAVGDRRGRNA